MGSVMGLLPLRNGVLCTSNPNNKKIFFRGVIKSLMKESSELFGALMIITSVIIIILNDYCKLNHIGKLGKILVTVIGLEHTFGR